MDSTESYAVTRRSDWILAAIIAPVFVVISLLTSLEQALVWSMVLAVFVSIVQTRWERRYQPKFISIMAFFAVAHVLVLAFAPISRFKFGLIVLPFAMVDALAMWSLIAWIDRAPATQHHQREDEQDELRL